MSTHEPSTPTVIVQRPSYAIPLTVAAALGAGGGGIALTLAAGAELVRAIGEYAGPVSIGVGGIGALRRKGAAK